MPREADLISVRLGPLVQSAERVAKRRGIPLSGYIRDAVNRAIEDDLRDDPDIKRLVLKVFFVNVENIVRRAADEGLLGRKGSYRDLIPALRGLRDEIEPEPTAKPRSLDGQYPKPIPKSESQRTVRFVENVGSSFDRLEDLFAGKALSGE